MSDLERELAILLTGRDVSASRAVRGVGKEINNLERIAGKAGRNVARNLERAVVTGAGAAAGAIAYTVKQAGDFDASLRTINTIARITSDGLGGVHDGLDDIGDSIRKIARETGTPLDELTAGYYDLLSAGVKAADATNVLTAANRLAIGGLASTAESVDLLTTAINVYGGDASKAGLYADYFAKAVERGKVKASEIAASFAQVGPIAKASGIEINEIAAAYARLTAQGVPAAEAATQMRSAIVALQKLNGPMAKLEKQTGHNYLAIAGRKGLVQALQIMRTDAEKAGVPLIKLLGRVEGLNFTLATTGPNLGAYNADLAAMGDSAGTAAQQMAERQQGLNFQLARLKANVTDAAITIGTELLPVFADLAGEGTSWLTAHQPEIKEFAKDLAKGIRDAVEWGKQLDWDAIANALKAGAGAAKTIVEAFMGLPAPIQQLLATGFVANKVTGGAVMDLAGLGAKLALRSMMVQAGVVNVNGPVAGGVGGAGAAGGGGALGLINKVFIVGMAAEAATQLAPITTGAGIALHDQLGLPTISPKDIEWPFGPKNTPTILPELFGGNGLLGGEAPKSPDVVAAIAGVTERQQDQLRGIEDVRDESARARIAIASAIQNKNLSVTVRPVTHVDVRVPVTVAVTGAIKRAKANYQSGTHSSTTTAHTGGFTEFD